MNVTSTTTGNSGSSIATTTTTTTTTTVSAPVQDKDTPCSIIGVTDTYTDVELKDALTKLYNSSSSSSSSSTTSTGFNNDNSNNDNDCNHIYGWNSKSNDWLNINENTHTSSLSMLQKITATVLLDYNIQRMCIGESSQLITLQELEIKGEEFVNIYGKPHNLQTVILSNQPNMTLAAEYKRASPSKGQIASKEHMDAAEQALKYMYGGANIISCLTESRYFHGTVQDLYNIRIQTQQQQQHQQQAAVHHYSTTTSSRPAILRKDFILSKYMIAEAIAAGADTVLLIVAILPISLLQELSDYCIHRGIVPLVEVHTNEELDIALLVNATVIGINNRNLHTFQLDLSTSERIAERLTSLGRIFRYEDFIKEQTTTGILPVTKKPYISLCALSGMSTCYDVDRYRKSGITMCLLGESLMRSTDPTAAITSLYLNPNDFDAHQLSMNNNNSNSDVSGATLSGICVGAVPAYTGGTQWIKICGITNIPDALMACQAGANLIGIIFVPKSKRCISSPAVANDIVQAVRQFGERSDRIEYNVPSTTDKANPIQHIVRSTMNIVQSAKHRPLVVGVFQNQDIEYINEMISVCGLDIIQLHGSEGMAASNSSHYHNHVPVIRVLDIDTDPVTGKATENAVDTILHTLTADPSLILLDTAIKTDSSSGGGGTGMAFDWSIANKIQDSGIPVIVAGGLTPTTIANCISQIRPFGVDVSSGVEIEPGTKDHDKVRTFIQSAKNAAVEANKGF